MVRIVSFAAAAAALSIASVAPATVPAMQGSTGSADGPLVTTAKPADFLSFKQPAAQPAEAGKVAMLNDGQSVLGRCMSAGGTVAQCIYWRLFL